MRYGVLASGNLGYIILEKLIKIQGLSFVFTDQNSNDIIILCKRYEIPLFLGNPRNGKSRMFLEQNICDVILSINYLFIVEEDVINHPSMYAINFHGSLLPKYRGRTPHVWAIINNEIKTGITAHLIDSGCDTGDIIEQIEIDIEKSETGSDILNKFNENYWPLIERVIEKIEKNKVTLIPQDHSKATYFGKRTPEDGKINWDWQKERIYNWVRALSSPYPGAFTFYRGEQVTIDCISYSDIGYEDTIPNGTVLTLNPVTVKTPNGVVKLDSIREDIGNIRIGEKLE